MLFISTVFINLNTGFQFIAAKYAADNKKLILMINALKLRLLFEPDFTLL